MAVLLSEQTQMNSISLHNRWEIFQMQEENDEEKTEDSVSEIISSTEQEAKIITAAADEETGGAWLVSKGRRRSTTTRRRKREICLLDTLPADVMSIIMQKLGAIEILPLINLVEKSWRNLAYHPSLYRCINLRNHTRSHQSHRLFNWAVVAVDLSKGQLNEFSIADYPGKYLLYCVLDKTILNSIKILRFVKCHELTDDLLLEFARKFSCLEELELSYCPISRSLDVIEQVGRMCSKLTRFRLIVSNTEDHYDDFPSVILKTMPKLLSLQLGNFNIHAKELKAILDGCPYLVYLDLRRCLTHIHHDEQKMFDGRIQCLRLYKEPAGDHPDDYILNYCEEICRQCPCDCGSCGRSFIFKYDPLDEDSESDVDDDYVLENEVFLPAKATAFYL